MARSQSRLDRAINIVVENGGKTAFKPLARKLGLIEDDIDTIIVRAPQDLTEQKQQMLRMWRQQGGARATPAVLMGACRQAGLTEVAEKIQKAMDRGTTSEQMHDDAYVGDVCEKTLKKYYKKTQSYYTPLNWCPWVEMAQKDNHVPVRVNRITRELCTPADLAKEELLTENDAVIMADNIKRVIFEGPPGIGKTTLLRNIVCHWSNGLKFKGLKMMFALKARHLKASEDLFEAIYQHNILPRDFVITKDRLQEWVQNNQEKVMFIIDAVEETPEFSRDDYVARLIFGNYLRESYVVLTTTAIHNLKVPILKSCDAYYVVEGFNQEDIDTFVGKFFKNDKEARGMRELLTQYEHTSLVDLCKTPMYLMLLCLLWKEKDRTRPDTVTGLFEGIVDISLRKYCKKNLHLDPQEEIPEDLQCKLDELYELSWKTLNKKGPIVLKESEVKNIRESMVKLGFLIKEKGHQAEKFAFGHRLLRELFAAKYVVKTNRKDLYDMMWSKGCHSMHKFNTVCLFVAGLLGEHANPLFESFADSHTAMTADPNCSQCCIDTNTVLACRCIVESTQPRQFGLFVAETLTANMGSSRVISFNFFRRHSKLNTLLGLSYIVENINCLDDHGRVDDSKRISLVLDNTWIYRQKGLVRLGQAIMKTRCIDSLAISTTGLDVSLTNPRYNDGGNEGMYSFFEAIGDPRSMIRALTISAQIDRMSESAIQAIPEAFKNNVNLEQLDLFTLFSMRCSYRCSDTDRRNLCARTKHIKMFLTDVKKAVESMSNLRTLRISANILREEMSKALFVPALESHSSIKALHVVGQVKGRGHLTMTGAKSLAGILEKNRKLEAVSIRLTTVSEDTGEPLAATLCKGLCRTSATSIELLFNCLLPREARIFADIVKTNANVTDVTYSWHTMFPSFLTTLANHVRVSTTLERLVLCGKFEDGESLVALVTAAMANKKLGSLVLNGKYFLDRTAVSVVTACLKEIQEERELERPFILHLSGDVVGDSAEAAMSELDQLSKSCADHNIVVHNTLSVEIHPDTYIGSLQLRAAMKAKRERRRTLSGRSPRASERSVQAEPQKVRKRRRGKRGGRNREEKELSKEESSGSGQNWLKWHVIVGLIIIIIVVVAEVLRWKFA